MNFFEQQDRARQNTYYLIGLFTLSVGCIVLAVYGLTWLTLGGAGASARVRIPLWNPGLFAVVMVPTLALIGGGTLYKLNALRLGGAVVATELGGQPIHPETTDPDEKQILNVVEEMAIAAGVSVPPVYLLDGETGINAFAAGFTPNDAVIGITRGCLDNLTRDELQGVIGHEFSHILNGDMRLNLRLVGVLHGILLIYLIGRVVLEGALRGRRSKDDSFLWVVGGGLIAIGAIGLFFGRLIKSAVSRQREFLADAASVQFTRNPDGIAGALTKIAEHSQHALLHSPYAEANSHLFFGSALPFTFLSGWFATHPPLNDRIRRIKGQSRAAQKLHAAAPASAANLSPQTNALIAGLTGTGSPTPTRHTVNASAEEVIAQVGTVAPEHFAYAHALLQQLPPAIQTGVHERQSAIAIVAALMLDRENPSVRDQQLQWLKTVETDERVRQVIDFAVQIDQLNPRIRLPLVDLTAPALRQSTKAQCERLFKCLQGLARMDKRWSLEEFVVYMVLWHRLQPVMQGKVGQLQKYTTLGSVWADCLAVLSALARVGHDRPEDRLYAFRSGASRLPGATQQTLPDTLPDCNFTVLKQSLDRLVRAAPKLKQSIVDACAYTVLLDQTVTLQEADLLRAIVILLDCPLPPFLSRPDRAA